VDDTNGVLEKKKEDLKQSQINVVKLVVKETLKQLEILEKQKNNVQDKIKILKHDLFDLKDGRLDRIKERQELNAETKNTSVISVSLVNQSQNAPSPWYVNYLLTVKSESGVLECIINNSITKMNASGTYKLDDNTIKYL